MAKNNDIKKTVQNESGVELKHPELMPSTPSQRTVSTFTFLIMSIGFYVQLVSFTSGAQLYPALSPRDIMLACFLGNGVVWIFLVLTGDIGIRYGIPYSVYARVPFGYIGAYIPGAIRALPGIFWFGFQTWLGSEAINEILKLLLGFDNLTVVIIVFGALQILNTALGINAIAKFDWVAAPILTLTAAYILYYLISRYNITWEIFNQAGTGDMHMPLAIATCAGAQITMAVNICDFTRFLKRPDCCGDVVDSNVSFFKLNSGSAWSQAIGILLPTVGFTAVGMLSGIATGEWNPITVMTIVFAENPVVMVLVLLSFVIFAQVSSNTGQNLLPPGYVLLNIFPKKLNFAKAVIISGTVGLLIMPWKFADNINTILLMISCLLGPILGVMVTDYYVIRKKKIDVDDLYNINGKYKYFKNVNPAALIVFIPGIILGLMFPDYAMFISFFGCSIIYYLLMKLWILKVY